MVERRYFHDLFGGVAKMGDIAETVILVNDPLSVEPLTDVIDEKVSVANHYQFRVVTGTWMESPITVCSTGIGGGSTSIAVDNLVRLGTKTILYVDAGNSGTGDYGPFLSTGAVRRDGASLDYVRAEYPAVADPEVFMACVAASRDLELPIKPALMWASAGPLTPGEVQGCETYSTNLATVGNKFVPGMPATGPEVATTLTLCTLYRVRGCAIYIGVEKPSEVFRFVRQYFQLALRAVTILNEWDLRKARLGWKMMTPPAIVK